MNPTTGTFYGVGVGPGDPELITLKAARIIGQANLICYLVNKEGVSQARDIAAPIIESAPQSALELPIEMPMDTQRIAANTAYDQAAASIQLALDKGLNVAFLCEGDPLFFGSYTYLQERLSPAYHCIVVPGISSPQAASAMCNIPLVKQAQDLAVISGRLSDEDILQRLKQFDNVVLMKAGIARPRILTLLHQSGRMADATYIEYATREQQHIVRDVSTLADEAGPYFSLFLVSRNKEQAQ